MISVGNEFSINEIRAARSADDIEQARRLFREYEAWLGISLCFQNFEQEMLGLPGDYAPPDGGLFFAYRNGQLAGCVALRKIGEGICEMKRLFVRSEFWGEGIGRLLVNDLIRAAKEMGYERMRLDTLPPRMDKAIALYRSLGFKEIESYYENPVPGAIFMELDLSAVSEARP